MKVLWDFCVVLIIVELFATVVEAANILCIFPTPSISHQVVYSPLTEELLKRGHSVLVITTDPIKKTDPDHKNLTQIDLHDISYNFFKKEFSFQERDNPYNAKKSVQTFLDKMANLVDQQLHNQEIQALILQDNKKFDLIILECLLYNAYFGFAHKFNAPIIGVSSLGAMPHVYDSIGNPDHPILTPSWYLGHSYPFPFWERLDSVLFYLWIRYEYNFNYLPALDKIAKKHFGDGLPYIGDLEKNIDLLFVNLHPVMNQRPDLPTVKYMGRMHLRTHKPLPNDLQKFLDDSSQGVVYFSLGTNVKSNTLDDGKLRVLMEAFRELPYQVLWKWESDNLSGQPPNVRIAQWLPQMDVLHHPNVKVFFTQGGLQSMDEAIYNEVPTLGMPFFADQDFNVNKMVKMGIGRKLEYHDLTKEVVIKEINEVINNKSYKETIAKVSRIMQDEPMSALDRTVWWTEYVIRHNGTKHLQPPQIPLYQYWLLDIMAFMLACLLVSLLVAYFVVTRIMFLAVKYWVSKKKKE